MILMLLIIVIIVHVAFVLSTELLSYGYLSEEIIEKIHLGFAIIYTILAVLFILFNHKITTS